MAKKELQEAGQPVPFLPQPETGITDNGRR
jgi:hypothetical protein